MERTRGFTIGDIIDRLEHEVDDVLEEKLILNWIDEGLLEISSHYGEPKSFIMIVSDDDPEEARDDFFDNQPDYKGVSVDWSKKGLKEGTKIIQSQVKRFVSLPEDFIKENEVVMVEHNQRTGTYVINSLRQIMFPIAGNYQINYQSLPYNVFREDVEVNDYYFPTHFLSSEEESKIDYKKLLLPIHYLFHPAMLLWCKHKYWEWESDASPGEVQHSENYLNKFYRKVEQIAAKLRTQKKYPDMIGLPNWGREVPTEWPF